MQEAQTSGPKPKTTEGEVDTLLALYAQRKDKRERPVTGHQVADPIQLLREKVVQEFVPVFSELAEKYEASGLTMEMDASDLMAGGREVKFEFAVGEHRSVLQGTATSDGIAFQETRYTPQLEGRLTSGPMLRLRNLTAQVFRDFICTRLSVLLRTALRQR
jgi:hypothetical protein